MILIYGTIDVEASSRAEVMAASLDHQNTSLSEPGCLAYVFTIDPEMSGRVHVLERWESNEALEAYMQTPRAAEFAKYMNDMAQRVAVTRYKVVEDQSGDFTRQSAALMGDSVQT